MRTGRLQRYIDSAESPETIQVVIEPVTPLLTALTSDKNDLGNSWGIHQVAKAIAFLVEQGMAHHNICISSVFVDKAGEWKLGGLELLTAESDAPGATVGGLSTPAKYAPPEGSDSQQSGPGDMWALGCLIWEVYNGELPKPELLKRVAEIPKKLLEPFVKLISANPRSRPSPKKFLSEARGKGKYLQNEFVDSNLFLDELAIKDKDEVASFYKTLPAMMDRFPKAFCIHKCAWHLPPCVACHAVLWSASEH